MPRAAILEQVEQLLAFKNEVRVSAMVAAVSML